LQEALATFSNVGDIILTGDFNAYSPQPKLTDYHSGRSLFAKLKETHAVSFQNDHAEGLQMPSSSCIHLYMHTFFIDFTKVF